MYCIEIITNHNHTNECNQKKKKKNVEVKNIYYQNYRNLYKSKE